MRIIAGKWRGRRLASVGKGDRGAHLRPTTDRTRESLFSTLQGGRFADPISDAQVLDLFAGTGALGLEALSRGAHACTFVENGRAALALLSENIKTLDANAKVLRKDATRPGPNPGPPASLIFLDPPYGANLGGSALLAAKSGGWIAPGALILWEENAPQTAPDGFTKIEEKRYGDTWISFLAHAT